MTSHNESLVEPRIETDRLLLRLPTADDAEELHLMLDNWQIVDTTSRIPFPCPFEWVTDWIEKVRAKQCNGEAAYFLLHAKDSGEIVGIADLEFEARGNGAEIGYWIGVKHWGKGYATEAAKALVAWGFETKEFHRIFAFCFTRNIPSAKVMEKLGMRHESHYLESVRKWGVYEDEEGYAILRREWEAFTASQS